ncbi:phage baseplate assembly protein V [Paraburkholderia sp. NMBU_R16]|uniref:phage baseplate assembly protein V n=1 Tax=Paraburkholderia sp. NMBU_R16 TaxID=2698676 RepID=UPI00156761B2|nr:phage baseplate assembly protein V [Paraburkholderia sp. NMBU_R16]NRO98122.1 phage baseplate assembly protein V [Paraburkholderia sp. NMBU_R16]
MDANEIQRIIRNLIRKGRITDLDLSAKPPTCRATVGESGDNSLQTNWIPWITFAAGTTRDWLPPTKGEQVVLLSPMGDPAQGVALRGLLSEDAPAPDDSPNAHTRVYPDGARLQYNHATHSLTAELPTGSTMLVIAPSSVIVKTKDATVQADAIRLDGDVTVTKSMTVKGPFAFESGMTGKSDAGGATMEIDGRADFTGEVTSKGKSLPHHSHREQGDGQLVGEPQ